MGRSKFHRNRNTLNDHFELQITSLADILTVVLVFLMKTFATTMNDGIANVVVPSSVELPSVSKINASEDGLRISVTANEIKISDGEAFQLQNFRFFPWDLVESGNTSIKTSKSLNQAFIKEKQHVNKSNPVLWIMADKRVPYATIQTVLASAATNGFSNIRLAVAKEE